MQFSAEKCTTIQHYNNDAEKLRAALPILSRILNKNVTSPRSETKETECYTGKINQKCFGLKFLLLIIPSIMFF